MISYGLKIDTAEYKNISMLPLETFKIVIASTPLISIDLILRNSKREILLGQRINRPAQGYWFVPGGRICKDESIEEAFKRLLIVELGASVQNLSMYRVIFKGVYQHFYRDNVAGSDCTTHYIVMAYEIDFDCSLGELPDAQHSAYKWLSEELLLKDNNVHKHTKWYFQKGQNADVSLTNSH